MYNVDRSASSMTRRLKARTLAVYHKNNPTLNDFGGQKPSDALTVLLRTTIGQKEVCDTCPAECVPVCDFPGAYVFTFLPSYFSQLETDLSNITGQTIVLPNLPVGYPSDRYFFLFNFPEICNATNYSTYITIDGNELTQQQYYLGMFNTPGFIITPRSGFVISYPLEDYPEGSFVGIVTASNECSDSSVTASFGCFLEGAQVAMADGSFKAIEKVEIGDVVLGAFGEHNVVNALHRPLLGAGCIANINGEHKTTTHHPHVSADKGFYCVDPKIINMFTYGKEHVVIVDKRGRKEKRTMEGLNPSRILKLEVGVELQTLTGARRVDTIETIKMSPFTQVYHLAVSGSHTFIVDGYAVTGWPKESDFNYDSWTPLA